MAKKQVNGWRLVGSSSVRRREVRLGEVGLLPNPEVRRSKGLMAIRVGGDGTS